MSGFNNRYESIAAEMRATVRQHTGIPTRVGIGPTKTPRQIRQLYSKEKSDLWRRL
ncbi:hypothetical protein [Brucella sp. LJL56]